jgi:hypothetical protein
VAFADLLKVLPKHERDRLLQANQLQSDLLRTYVDVHSSIAAELLRFIRSLYDPQGKLTTNTVDAARSAAILRFINERVSVLDHAVGAALSATTQPLGDLVQKQLGRELRVLDLGLPGPVDYRVIEDTLADAASRIQSWNRQLAPDTLNALRLGLIRGESYRDLAARVGGVQSLPTARAKAHMLANVRYSVVHAANAARQDSYSTSASEANIKVQKMWWSNIADCCINCARMHGTIVDMDQEFPWKGLHLTITPFGEVLWHPPLHPNCRCRILPITIDVLKTVDLPGIRRERSARIDHLKTMKAA